MKKEVGSISQRYGSGDPDPHPNVTDPQHCLEQKGLALDDGWDGARLRGGQREVNIWEQRLQLVQQGGQTEQQTRGVFSMVVVAPSVVVVQQHTGQLLYHLVYLRQEFVSAFTRSLYQYSEAVRFDKDPDPWIRTLDYWPGSGSRSCSFWQWLSSCQEKLRLFAYLFLTYRFRYIIIILQR